MPGGLVLHDAQLERARNEVAMANARQVLKDVADGVTEHSNECDGVARELERLVAQGLLCAPPSPAARTAGGAPAGVAGLD